MNEQKTATGPSDPCQRTTCADKPAHLGGEHLNPASEHYDGPDAKLNALPMACRRSAQTLMHTARRKGWDRLVVETALHELAGEIHRLRQQVAAVQVDADHKVIDAMKRSEDCAEHGATIRSEAHSAYWFSVWAEATDAERVAWVSAVHEIREAFTNRDDPLAKAVVKFCDKAETSAKRARARFEPPTFADCQRAGNCEHPKPPPHAACEQLRLDFDTEVAA